MPLCAEKGTGEILGVTAMQSLSGPAAVVTVFQPRQSVRVTKAAGTGGETERHLLRAYSLVKLIVSSSLPKTFSRLHFV